MSDVDWEKYYEEKYKGTTRSCYVCGATIPGHNNNCSDWDACLKRLRKQ